MNKLNQKEKEQFVHQVFESIAPKYDFMNTVLSFGRHKAWRNFAMKKMNVQPSQQAIDVCCGTCDWTISMAEKVGPSGKVIGLDFSQNMLEYGEQKSKRLGYAHIQLVHGNVKNAFEGIT